MFRHRAKEISDKNLSEGEKKVLSELMIRIYNYGQLSNWAVSENNQEKKQQLIFDAIKLTNEALEIHAFPGFVFDKAFLLSMLGDEEAARAENTRFFIMLDMFNPGKLDKELMKVKNLNKMRQASWLYIKK